jgi:hypothetical protein
MIVGSLLLILVAVTMLIMGLAAGSSGLLIGSIAASLLAAVALVVGARQAAAARAEAGGAPRSPLAGDLGDPGPATAVFDSGALHSDDAFGDGALRRRTGENAARTGEGFGDDHPGDGWSSVAVADPDSDRASDFAARSADTEILHPGHDVLDPGHDTLGPEAPLHAQDADPAYGRPVDDDFAAWSGQGRGDARHEPVADIGVDGPTFGDHDLPDPAQADPVVEMPPVVDAATVDATALDATALDAATLEAAGAAATAADPIASGPMAADQMAADQVAVDEFDEDPADEPLPQRVQPTDAVRVSRMTVDVLVVDGRPRYHLADCPHLDGKECEPIPVGEAVDLGFTPCGLCRPVDSLVAEAARR